MCFIPHFRPSILFFTVLFAPYGFGGLDPTQFR